jgi:hypothetical protein
LVHSGFPRWNLYGGVYLTRKTSARADLELPRFRVLLAFASPAIVSGVKPRATSQKSNTSPGRRSAVGDIVYEYFSIMSPNLQPPRLTSRDLEICRLIVPHVHCQFPESHLQTKVMVHRLATCFGRSPSLISLPTRDGGLGRRYHTDDKIGTIVQLSVRATSH